MDLYKQKGSSHWSYDFTVNGRRVRGSTKQTNHQVAEQVANDAWAKARKEGVEAVQIRPQLLSKFADEFLQ